MTHLSVNINKIATLRNARGGDTPNVCEAAVNIQRFGGQGITVHPRPDQRHIRYQDVFDLRPLVHTEFNIEGYPHHDFIDMVLQVKPEQVTLVPDADHAITSNAGWDTRTHQSYLKEVVAEFRRHGIRCSLFVDPVSAMIEAAATTGTDRIELYTEAYAHQYPAQGIAAAAPYVEAAQTALDCGLGINAGHDLSLDNIADFKKAVPGLLEVSIGHALISEALYLGLENTIQLYLHRLQ